MRKGKDSHGMAIHDGHKHEVDGTAVNFMIESCNPWEYITCACLDHTRDWPSSLSSSSSSSSCSCPSTPLSASPPKRNASAPTQTTKRHQRDAEPRTPHPPALPHAPYPPTWPDSKTYTLPSNMPSPTPLPHVPYPLQSTPAPFATSSTTSPSPPTLACQLDSARRISSVFAGSGSGTPHPSLPLPLKMTPIHSSSPPSPHP